MPPDPPDVLATVIARHHELGQIPLARRLAEITVGPTSLWDAVRYDVADVLYDDVDRELGQEGWLTSSVAPGWVARNLWQGQIGQEFLVGLLSARLGLVGDLIESGLARAHRLAARPGGTDRADVLVAGSLYRHAVAALGPVLQRLERDDGLQHLVVAHDDVLLRHARAFRRAGLRWRQAAVFSSRRQRTTTRAAVERTRKALAEIQPSPRDARVEAFVRRRLSPRNVARLVGNFLAVEVALSASDPSVVVIPDERQPLARLVGLEARRRGLPVVSIPLDRDQIYRKTPLWDGAVSTRILVSSPLAARFLGRAGAPHELFAVASRLVVDPETTGARARIRSECRKLLNLEANTKIVLFASQGQVHNSILLPALNACSGAIPGSTLVIRPHPYEFPPLVRLMNRGVHVSTAMSASEAILAADVLVTHSSYMAVEAALLGCPVILVSADAVPSLLPLIAEGLARWACTKDELQRALVDLLRGGDSRLDAAQERFRRQQAEIAGFADAANVIAELARTPAPGRMSSRARSG